MAAHRKKKAAVTVGKPRGLVLVRANAMTPMGSVYPATELAKLADNLTTFWDEDAKALVYRGDQPVAPPAAI